VSTEPLDYEELRTAYNTAYNAWQTASIAARDARSALDLLGFSREPALQAGGVVSRLGGLDTRVGEIEKAVAKIADSVGQDRRERRILYAALTLVALLVSAWIVVGFVDRARAQALERAQQSEASP